jgi:3-phosphoshikimate 1-carboxyvinyltransferase
MAPLIDALRQLGADITGDRLPLKIIGHPIMGGHVTLDASQSSQFASSLLLAAPTWGQGLQLTLTGNPVSMPYLEMTIKMMEYYGVQVVRKGNTITVAHQPYQDKPFSVSPDWSAASYWYEMMAVSDGGSLILNGLRKKSLQGDAVVADWFRAFGVTTSFEGQGVRLTKNDGAFTLNFQPLTFDFTDTPDLFPSVFVTCVMLHYQARFQGIANLSLKESNRVDSLISELSKYYTFINILTSDEIVIDKSIFNESLINNNKVIINTYKDHRIAMALAPILLHGNQVVVDDPSVVTKSYPAFWENIKKNYVSI